MKVFPQGSPRKSLVVVAASLALLLSSCAQNPPGVAAEVDGSRITDAQVDDFAHVLCALNTSPGGAEGQSTPSRSVRLRALELLLDIQIAGKIADLGKADEAQVADAVTQAAATRGAVPDDLKGVFDDAVRDYAVAQLALIELGRESLAAQGTKNADDQAAFSEGDRLRVKYASTADITIDPRFGTLVDGTLTPTSGSLSVPVSDAAKQAASANPSPDFTATLPASQTCS